MYLARKEMEKDMAQRLADKLAETAILVLRSVRPEALAPAVREAPEVRRERVMAELKKIMGEK
jgi:hypothetical protein